MSDGNRYWKASGKTAKELKAKLDLLLACREEADVLAKEFGAIEACIPYGSWGVEIAFAFKEHPGKDWKKRQSDRGFNWYNVTARKSAKPIADKVRDLVTRSPCGDNFCEIIGMKDMVGDCIRRPGMKTAKDGMIYVITPDDYKPPNGVSLKRVSDVEFEKLKF